MANSQFGDFRPVRVGDNGFDYRSGQKITITEKDVKSRKHISSTGEVIPLRQYQNRQRGLTYTQFVRKREKEGITKKEYKTKGHTKIGIPKPKSVRPLIQVAAQKARMSIEQARKRRDYLQDAWARKKSQDYGQSLSFDELSPSDKSDFWPVYDDLVRRPSQPRYDEWVDGGYEELLDMTYDDTGDLAYGETP